MVLLPPVPYNHEMKVAVLGLGYVGSVTAACLANAGHTVVGADPDDNKVSSILAGRSPIVEPGLDDLIAAAVASGQLTATASTTIALDAADLSLVCVGTPSRHNGSLDLRYVTRVCEEIGSWLAGHEAYHSVVIRSTLLPGTLEQVVLPILEESSGKRADTDFGLAMCPEFLRETTAVDDFYDPPFTVIGVRDHRTGAAVRDLLGFIDRPWHEVPVATAEAIKYSCNAFHAVKVTFANEMARALRVAGVDGREVMRIFCEDNRLNLSGAYLRPGFSFGGSCLPKDLRALLYLARANDQDLPMLAALLPSNDVHLRDAVRAVLDSGHRRVALLGLSFKAGTDDLRESPYVELAEGLLGKGIDLRIYDPAVHPERLFGSNQAYVEQHLPHLSRLLCRRPEEALEGAGGAVVTTADHAVVDALLAADPPLVLDLCGRLPAPVEQMTGYRGTAW